MQCQTNYKFLSITYSNDCGVFVMHYLDALVNGQNIPSGILTQVSIRLFIDKKLIDECN